MFIKRHDRVFGRHLICRAICTTNIPLYGVLIGCGHSKSYLQKLFHPGYADLWEFLLYIIDTAFAMVLFRSITALCVVRCLQVSVKHYKRIPICWVCCYIHFNEISSTQRFQRYTLHPVLLVSYYICNWMNIVDNDDKLKRKRFTRYWPFVPGIHRSSVNSPHKSQWRGALIFPLICVWTHDWVNTRNAGDWRSHRAQYDVTVMPILLWGGACSFNVYYNHLIT